MEENQKKGSSNIIIYVIVGLLLLAGAGWFVLNSQSKNQAPQTTENTSATEETNNTSENTTDNVTADGEVKTFEVAASNFKFDQKEIRVKKGDTVKIMLTNTGGNHDWKVDEFNAATEIIGEGGTAEVEFVADKVGTFEYYCSVGTHRQMGMVGNLIVEE